jgi:hypothetical protein
MSQGDSYCCQNSTTNCESCLFQNTHCLEFMVGAVIGCLLSFLLMVYLIWVCRSHRRNIQRSLLSSTVSLLIEPASQ